MPVIYQKMILRDDLRSNPDTLYVFGDNVERWGMKGQAKEMRGEPNAVGIPTKWTPNNLHVSFFSDDDFDKIYEIWKKDIPPLYKAILAHKVVVWPTDGIGTGLSDLPRSAPKVFNLLGKVLTDLASYTPV
jgi:hypothetical protein